MRWKGFFGSETCPDFCGKIRPSDNSTEAIIDQLLKDEQSPYGGCGRCPWGTKAVNNLYCEPCKESLLPYDFAFLALHALLPCLINVIIIKCSPWVKRSVPVTKVLIVIQMLCAFAESILSMMLIMMLYPPRWSLNVYSCRNHKLYQWYSMMYSTVTYDNPPLRCGSEVVYPLYSLPFFNLFFNLLITSVVRIILFIFTYGCTSYKLSSNPIYGFLWTIPILSVIHAVFSGFIYYVFPYLLVAMGLGLNAYHFAMAGRKNFIEFMKFMLSDWEHFFIYLAHLTLLSFAMYTVMLSLPGYEHAVPKMRDIWVMLCLLPLPSIYYVLSIRLTVPENRVQRIRF